jgi:hypothetical protein
MRVITTLLTERIYTILPPRFTMFVRVTLGIIRATGAETKKEKSKEARKQGAA